MTKKEFFSLYENRQRLREVENLPAACSKLWPKFPDWDEDKQEFTAAFDTTEEMGNPVYWLHGGVIATIFDNGMGTLASIVSGGYMVPTISMNINYLRPAPLVGRVILRASVLKSGQNLIYTTATLYAEDAPDKPLSSATGVYTILREVKV